MKILSGKSKSVFTAAVILSILIFAGLFLSREFHIKSKKENRVLLIPDQTPEESPHSPVTTSKSKPPQYMKVRSVKEIINNKKNDPISSMSEKKYPVHLISDKILEKGATARRKHYNFYYVPFLVKEGIAPDVIDELTEHFTAMVIEREKIYHKYKDKYGGKLDIMTFMELNDEVDFFNEDYDDKFFELLGADIYERYLFFDKTLINREAVLGFNGILDSDEKLNDEKVEEFIISLHDIDVEFYPENSRYNPVTKDVPYSYMKYEELKQKEYLIEARRLLTRSQYKKFVSYMKKRNEVINGMVAEAMNEIVE